MHALYFWVERYLFRPSLSQKFLSFALLPLSALYCLVVVFRRTFSHPKDFGVPIVSIGNLIVGGSGKTPVTIAIANQIAKPKAIVLRGYGRRSKGLAVVSREGKILTDVLRSGDEAMLLARSTDATVIVSSKREIAIDKAIRMGAKVVLLDDGFGKTAIEKLDILLRPKKDPDNPFCLPSGPYREPAYLYEKGALTLRETYDFKRTVTIQNPTPRMLLVTAISKPERLDPYLPPKIPKVLYPDHYDFKKEELVALLAKHKATSILTTAKDAVKMERFGLPLSLLDLKVEIDAGVMETIENFIASYDKIPQKE